ncbi:unnamed protein product [Staurois parvus]|uniref:Uncharacterized protein n=1 Tax=Staurois parvus TaxID=386267 RepID=A0ABN9G9S8_9NEOB|nr:unnamed protein product [Staurois parvus]
MLTRSCPVPLVQCQCFLLALITVLVSLRMSLAAIFLQCQNACCSPAIITDRHHY